MATFDRSFIDGVLWRMIGLGAIAALLTGWLISLRFGYSLAFGTAIGAASLRMTIVAVEGLLQAAVDGGKSGSGWAVLIGIKLMALLASVVVVLALFKADPIAFVIGFKMILPAIAWQAIRKPRFLDEDDDDAADQKESL